jgi:hypothetical protein
MPVFSKSAAIVSSRQKPNPRAGRRPLLESPTERLEGRLLLSTASANGNPVPIYIYSDPSEVPTRASVYASLAIIRDIDGPISDVRVTLTGFSHEAPEDVDVLLVSPAGTGVILMSDAGSQFSIADPGVDITFSDSASRDLPEFDQIRGGSYRPTNYDDVEQGQQPFPYSAPEPPYETTMAAFQGQDPTPESDNTGRWLLYVVDDGPFGADGVIYGWTITVTTGGGGPAAPSTPDLSSSSDTGASGTDNVTRDTTPTFSGTAAEGTEVHLYSDGLQVGTAPINATTRAWSITAGPLEEGSHLITAAAADATGEGNMSGEIQLEIDTTAPPAPSTPDLADASDTGPSNTDNITDVATPTFVGTAPESSSVTLVAGGRPIGTGVVAGDGSYTATVSPALAAGAYDVLAAATDLAGNSSQPSAALHVQIQSTTVPPTNVSQVFVNGGGITGQTSANGTAFRTLAGIDNVYGYPVPAGANQTKSIPWSNGVDKVSLRFTTDVAAVLQKDDLVIRGANLANYPTSAFAYEPATKTGTWTLSTTIVNDKIRLFLDDALVANLDGEWADGADAYPSGNGTPGGDFSFSFHVLRGDANQDGQVSALDLGQLKSRLNRNATTNQGSGSTGYNVFADLNADGQINAQDLGIAKLRLNTRLPTGEPAATSLLFGRAPISA